MGLKIVIFWCLMALVKCAVLPAVPSAPLVASPVLARIGEDTIDPNPAYSFGYDVQDALTGDSKGQVESRANGIVQGQYNVAEPDGTRRIVDYTADAINGFNAVVRRAPQAVAAPLIARAAPVIAAPAAAAPLVAAPAVARVASPAFVGAYTFG